MESPIKVPFSPGCNSPLKGVLDLLNDNCCFILENHNMQHLQESVQTISKMKYIFVSIVPKVEEEKKKQIRWRLGEVQYWTNYRQESRPGISGTAKVTWLIVFLRGPGELFAVYFFLKPSNKQQNFQIWFLKIVNYRDVFRFLKQCISIWNSDSRYFWSLSSSKNSANNSCLTSVWLNDPETLTSMEIGGRYRNHSRIGKVKIKGWKKIRSKLKSTILS